MQPAPSTTAEVDAYRIGRFAGWLYGVAGALTLAWAAGSGQRIDGWLIALLGVCAGAFVFPLHPVWATRGQLLSQIMVATAGAVLVVFTPLITRDPVLLLLPALAAAYTGAAVDRRWLLSLVPFTVTLGLFLADERGARAGWVTALTYLGLWVTIGSVAVWMRAQVELANQRILAEAAQRSQQADEEAARKADEARRAEAALAERIEVAKSVQGSVEAVSTASAEIEDQSTTIAAAVEELATSLREAGDTAARTEASLERIQIATAGSQESIGRLDSAGKEIVGIVDTITDLSEQTNLLALNATIESARAGEAGKGFAVVANEVKDLAHLTAKSASEISSVVDQIQQRLAASNQSIESIAELVTALEADQFALGAAVSQQTSVVENISASAATGALRVSEIGQAIRDLDRDAARLANDH